MRSDYQRRWQHLLRGGLTPSDLALAVTVGIVIGCLPIFGVSTLLCLGLATCMRLNLVAIQADNWFAMPLQVLLFLPFLRLGKWLFRHPDTAQAGRNALGQIWSHGMMLPHMPQIGWLFAHLVLAWLVVAIPVATLLYTALRRMFCRMARAMVPADPA